MSYDKSTFIGRNLSSSYAPTEQDANYFDYINELSSLFDAHQINGTVLYPYVTRLYIGEVGTN